VDNDPAAAEPDDGVAPSPEDAEADPPQPPRDRSWIFDVIGAIFDLISVH
jgi:hypothetical protein